MAGIVSVPSPNLIWQRSGRGSSWYKTGHTSQAYSCVPITLFQELIWFQRTTLIFPDRVVPWVPLKDLSFQDQEQRGLTIVCEASASHTFRSSSARLKEIGCLFGIFCFVCEVYLFLLCYDVVNNLVWSCHWLPAWHIWQGEPQLRNCLH